MVHKNNFKKMSFETAKKAVDYALKARDIYSKKSVVWDFIGGEPFLEIDLIDKISDYIKEQMYLTKHPWFDDYMFSFSTNGLLYGTKKVQDYIKKNKRHISIGIRGVSGYGHAPCAIQSSQPLNFPVLPKVMEPLPYLPRMASMACSSRSCFSSRRVVSPVSRSSCW